MITDEALEERRNQWLTSINFRNRYEIIRKAVEGEYRESEQNGQLKWFTPHGPDHCKAVENILYDLLPIPYETKEKSLPSIDLIQIAPNVQLSEIERFYLINSAWLHDLGMIKQSNGEDSKKGGEEIRDNHHIRSEKFIVEHFAKLQLFESEVSILGTLAYYHRRRCPIDECPELIKIIDHKDTIRVRLLAAYLRLADAMHVDISRAPSTQYAILLTYNIPTANKLHWLKSNFVLGILPDLKDKSLTVIFKEPTDEIIRKCIDDTTYSIDPKLSDAIKANSNTFQTKENLFKKTLDGIFDEIHKDLQSELDSIKEVLIRGNISCFLNVKKVTHQFAMRDGFINDLKTIRHHYPSTYNPSSTSLYRIIIDTLLGICETTRNESLASLNEKVDTFLKDIEDNILTPRQTYKGLHNLYDAIKMINDEKYDRNQKLVEAIANDYKDNKEAQVRIKYIKEKVENKGDEKCKTLSELEIFLYHKHNKLNEDIGRIRMHATDNFRELLVDELFGSIYGKNILNINNGSTNNEGRAHATSHEEKNNYSANGENPKEKNENDNTEIIKERVNILLYGYSELVIKTLCGFRDAVIKKIIDDLSNSEIKKAHKSTEWNFQLHKSDIEKTASNFFRIFVCEGQPKNRLGWAGKVIFHDGTSYALKLQEYGFTNIFLIPDATAATLLTKNNKNFDIHLVLLGANSYNKEGDKIKSFTHSTGHAMVANLTKKLKDDIDSDKPKEGVTDEKQKTMPKLIFTVTTDKEGETETHLKKSHREEEEGLYFVRFNLDEIIKKRFFFAHNSDTKERLKASKDDIMIYNPKEEKIDGAYADVVIDENGLHSYPFDKLQQNR